MVGTRTPDTPPGERPTTVVECAATDADANPQAEAMTAITTHSRATRERSRRRGPDRVRRSRSAGRVVSAVRTGCLRGECPPPATGRAVGTGLGVGWGGTGPGVVWGGEVRFGRAPGAPHVAGTHRFRRRPPGRPLTSVMGGAWTRSGSGRDTVRRPRAPTVSCRGGRRPHRDAGEMSWPGQRSTPDHQDE